jgi:hypothetical protein
MLLVSNPVHSLPDQLKSASPSLAAKVHVDSRNFVSVGLIMDEEWKELLSIINEVVLNVFEMRRCVIPKTHVAPLALTFGQLTIFSALDYFSDWEISPILRKLAVFRKLTHIKLRWDEFRQQEIVDSFKLVLKQCPIEDVAIFGRVRSSIHAALMSLNYQRVQRLTIGIENSEASLSPQVMQKIGNSAIRVLNLNNIFVLMYALEIALKELTSLAALKLEGVKNDQNLEPLMSQDYNAIYKALIENPNPSLAHLKVIQKCAIDEQIDNLITVLSKHALVSLSVTFSEYPSFESKEKLKAALAINRSLRFLKFNGMISELAPILLDDKRNRSLEQTDINIHLYLKPILDQNKLEGKSRVWTLRGTTAAIAWMRANGAHPFKDSILALLSYIIYLSTDERCFGGGFFEEESPNLTQDFDAAAKTDSKKFDRLLSTLFVRNEVARIVNRRENV